jgi:hypothetical protein
MQQLNIIRNTLVLSLIFLLSSEARSQSQYDTASLVNSISDINNTINSGLYDFGDFTAWSMEAGNTIIYNKNTGEQFKLTQQQVDQFNTAYAEGLQKSTPEALVSVVLDDLIEDQQYDYEEAKESLIEAASDIAEVTEVAEIIATGNQSTVIAAQDYAVENELTEIKQEDVQQYNTSIDAMLEASITKNMIEAYSQDIQVVDTIADLVINTESTQAFFDTVTISISEMSPAMLTVEWEGYAQDVYSDMYYAYAPIPDLEAILR